MKKILHLATITLLTLILCSCAKTQNETTPTSSSTPTVTLSLKEEPLDTLSNETRTDNEAETTTPPSAVAKPTPETTATPESIVEENDTGFRKSDIKLRIVDSREKELSDLDYDEMDELSKYDLDICLITFPSLNTLNEDRFEEANSAEELLNYINENDNIWKTDDDIWIFQKKEFHHTHDYFYNISWLKKDDIHYFIAELTTFLPKKVLEVNEDKLYYNEDTKTLYLHFTEGLRYETYVSQTDKASAERIENEALSNRGILAFNNKNDYEIKEIVLVKPFLLKR